MNDPNAHQHPTEVGNTSLRSKIGQVYRYFAYCTHPDCHWQGDLWNTEAAAEADGDEHTLAMQGEAP